MEWWQIFSIIGLTFLILEMLVPSMFFFNLAFAGFITAIVAVWLSDWIWLTIIFSVLALLSILLLRPLMLRSRKTKEQTTGMESKYVGKVVKVIEPIGRLSGAITVYDERWEARADVNEPIAKGEAVKIIKYDSLVLTVEKIKE
ncbi:MAG: NfeD family protein [Alphaproteobacteria bacterium]|nr:NfeD family protein [Alphaproteobacteria bacterium]